VSDHDVVIFVVLDFFEHGLGAQAEQPPPYLVHRRLLLRDQALNTRKRRSEAALTFSSPTRHAHHPRIEQTSQKKGEEAPPNPGASSGH